MSATDAHRHDPTRCLPCRAQYARERRLVVQNTAEVGRWMRPLPQRAVDRTRWFWFCRTVVERIEATRLEGNTP